MKIKCDTFRMKWEESVKLSKKGSNYYYCSLLANLVHLAHLAGAFEIANS